eukprot:4249112-Pleurochrysis_carterae.AAC.1
MSVTCCREVSNSTTKAARIIMGMSCQSAPSMAIIVVRQAVCRGLVPSVIEELTQLARLRDAQRSQSLRYYAQLMPHTTAKTDRWHSSLRQPRH